MTGLTPESVRTMLDAATPGPWMFKSGAPARPHAYGVQAEDGEPVTLTFSILTDARLIAAAPDLARAYLTQASALERVQAPLTKTERDLIIETGRHVYGCCSDDCPDHGLPEDAQILAVERILRDRALAGPTPSGDQT